MDVQNTPPKFMDEIRAQDSHEASKNHQRNTMLAQFSDQRFFENLLVRILLSIDAEMRDTRFFRPLQRLRIRLVRQHYADRRGNLPAVHCRQNRL